MNGQQPGQDPCNDTAGNLLPCSCTPTSKPGIRGFFSFIFSCCPYTMIGKKIVRILRGETGKLNKPPSNSETNLRSQIKLGSGIMLVGVFCPFFWISLLSGSSPSETWVYGVHSCAFIVFGLVVMGKGWYDLKQVQAIRE